MTRSLSLSPSLSLSLIHRFFRSRSSAHFNSLGQSVPIPADTTPHPTTKSNAFVHVDERLDTLRAQIKMHQDTIIDLQSQMATVRAEVTTRDSTIQHLRAEIYDLQHKLQEIESKREVALQKRKAARAKNPKARRTQRRHPTKANRVKDPRTNQVALDARVHRCRVPG
ncbi:uncharacterized protein MONBRDRAFT_22522 [Monosiga brevicollis MX1]|uniref:Uncharacterized protein n=1 Tax=Monosiga brevicollis TaxID=81824 RepID=A9UQU1_MONBE|nr:uncharacterized protein MONBRDRAFT_22522 [Monosiga brevicollis MX1]EDQ93104.1 predicted protein [Monosiga brevicollis MX1]|eukprot:XP_001742866.1 hypothetical protein [Monosiga brevicollis MX1]